MAYKAEINSWKYSNPRHTRYTVYIYNKKHEVVADREFDRDLDAAVSWAKSWHARVNVFLDGKPYSVTEESEPTMEFETVLLERIIVPTANINGTSYDDLLEQYLKSKRAVEDAIHTMRKHSPHGRDYQSHPDGEYEIARKQYESRIQSLVEVREYLSGILDCLLDQRN